MLQQSLYRMSMAHFYIFEFTPLYGHNSGVVLAFAKDNSKDITGQVYTFDSKSKYVIAEALTKTASDSGAETYGRFSINGDIVSANKDNDLEKISIGSGKVNFQYSYGDSLLNASEDKWHLIEDKAKEIDSIDLDSKVGKGTYILQVSNDQLNWTTVLSQSNIFEDTPNNSSSIYEATDIQLLNGCYYRFIVAYEVERTVGSKKIVVISTAEKETERRCEIYQLYIKGSETPKTDNATQYTLAEVSQRVKDNNGYAEGTEITEKDPHYGWSIGKLFVTGHTSVVKNEVGEPVILKNTGDNPTLWFKLNYDINSLNNNDAIKICADPKGFDQNMQTKTTDLKRGALFVRAIDSDNNRKEPVIYVDYLGASASVNADTKVQLLEEGDYEISLVYAIKNDKTVVFGQSILPQMSYYKMTAKFSVRNGNCMVFPFDLSTGGELTNNALSKDGFRIDLAKSKYLTVSVKKEVLSDNGDNISEDVRFNKIARDGMKYTDEGIYTITAHNPYTDQTTEKRIVVGDNKVLKAYVVTGLTISEIQSQLSDGATITDTGEIIPPVKEEEPKTDPVKDTKQKDESKQESKQNPVPKTNDAINDDNQVDETSSKESSLNFLYVLIPIIIIAAIVLVSKKKKNGLKEIDAPKEAAALEETKVLEIESKEDQTEEDNK